MNINDYEDLPTILSIEDLMKFLGIGKNSAYNLVRSGQIKSVRIGRQIRITRESVIAFVQHR